MIYSHLSQEERYQIYALLNAGQPPGEIAVILGRHKSTIGRELSRNSGLRGYSPQHAERLAQARSQACRNGVRIRPADWSSAVGLLSLQWSPEQIASRVAISHETIYRRIYANKAAGGDLWRHLRCQKKRRKRYASGRDKRGQIIGRRAISERPAHVEARSHIGHWEGDTVIGAGHKQAIVSVVERKSGYAILAKVANKTADLVASAIVNRLSPLAPLVKTITYDNGKEFADHAHIDNELGSTAYFADPFSSWQRGTNKNLNGLVRQYVPKKRPLSTVTERELAMIEYRLNNRPRKRLGFRTPYEVFTQSIKRVALQA
ncbi:MAG: IS30 family transposase [Acetobacteraceae bacterium]|nr:IS30 family transposase [Acetobacteraceae bacterium]